MRYFVAMLLSTLVAVAAPAPPARSSKKWTVGWHEPVSPDGNCLFDRAGDRLTITVPGKGNVFDLLQGQLNAPQLVRDVEGDFVVQVRVSGDFGKGDRAAGILLAHGNRLVRVVRAIISGNDPLGVSCIGLWETAGRGRFADGPPLERGAYLQLERRGDLLWASSSENGQDWKLFGTLKTKLPWKVKVGVVAEASAPGTFKAVFDQFKLTPLGGKIR